MSDATFVKRWLTILLTLLLVYGIWHLRSIWILGFTAIVIAVGISAPARGLQLIGAPRSLALGLSVLAIGAITTFLLFWIVPTLVQENERSQSQ